MRTNIVMQTYSHHARFGELCTVDQVATPPVMVAAGTDHRAHRVELLHLREG